MDESAKGFLCGLLRGMGHDGPLLNRAMAAGPDIETLRWADRKTLRHAGLTPRLIGGLMAARVSIRPDEESADLRRHDIKVLTIDEAAYPPLLRQITDPPLAIFTRGAAMITDNDLMLAVVGTRKMSDYGRRSVKKVTEGLVAAGAVIVSGLALGTDGEAHRTTLDAGGLTIAVTGSGVDDSSIYPRSHVGLARRILERSGALISEHPPGTRARKHHFPLRNRIVAGLCHGVAVMEAAERSGALITARLALNYDREVFALPGPIDSPRLTGSNRLIAQGACPILSGSTLPRHFGRDGQARTRTDEPTDPAGTAVLAALHEGYQTLDRICSRTGLETGVTLSILTSFEIEGTITRTGGRYFI